MKTTAYLLAMILFLSSCGGGSDLDNKKEKLKSKQKELEKIEADIAKLKSEIVKADPDYFKGNERIILVTSTPSKVQDFAHFIEVRGVVESDKNVTLNAKTNGIITGVYVAEGQRIGQGTTLITQDADIIQNNIAELRTRLQLAKTVYEKQERLWKQKIGTEIQYLEAKNNKESLEKNIAVLQAQAAQSVLVA
ncbi:MAG: efflux RND transporter periplasmic adaptor subunit, partial [Bacteroidota bacterium]